jgi:ABC-type multidrug transport system fused ATPase/permease subunit
VTCDLDVFGHNYTFFVCCIFTSSGCRENIAFGLDHIPAQEEVEKAARDANIHDFIVGLPEKYETRIGGKGERLSGGQKQRIGLSQCSFSLVIS